MTDVRSQAYKQFFFATTCAGFENQAHDDIKRVLHSMQCEADAFGVSAALHSSAVLFWCTGDARKVAALIVERVRAIEQVFAALAIVEDVPLVRARGEASLAISTLQEHTCACAYHVVQHFAAWRWQDACQSWLATSGKASLDKYNQQGTTETSPRGTLEFPSPAAPCTCSAIAPLHKASWVGMPIDDQWHGLILRLPSPADRTIPPIDAASQQDAAVPTNTPRFRVSAFRNRFFKHSLSSCEMAGAIGAGICRRYQWQVDLQNFDCELYCHIVGTSMLVGIALSPALVDCHLRNRIVHGTTSLMPRYANGDRFTPVRMCIDSWLWWCNAHTATTAAAVVVVATPAAAAVAYCACTSVLRIRLCNFVTLKPEM
jgi:hypothetical protein